MARRGGDMGPPETKVYVGGLPENVNRDDIESVFTRFGECTVWVARRPPGFAFIKYRDQRDAEDAVRSLDGTRICGMRVRVEISHGRPRGNGPPLGNRYSSSWEDRHGGGDGGGRGGGGYGGGRDKYERSPRGGGSRGRSRSRSPRRYGGGGDGGGGAGGRSRSRSPGVRARNNNGGRYGGSRSRSRD